MRRFVAVKHAFLHHDHAVSIGAPIDDAGTDTAAGALTTGDDGIDSQISQVSYQRRAPKRAGRGLTQDCFAQQGCDLINNLPTALASVESFGTQLSWVRWLTPGRPSL